MNLPQEQSYINIRGVEHYYEWIRQPNLSGTSQPMPKPVMVFLHGWGGSGRYWRSTAAALSDQFDCLIYDLRGFGRSLISNASVSLEKMASCEAAFTSDFTAANYKSVNYEMVDYADDLVILLDQLQLDRVYLNAHSMGGSIAACFLNQYPERVYQAILTCMGIFEYDEKAFKLFHKFSRYVVQFRPKWLRHIPFMDRMFMARFLYQPIPKVLSQAFLEDFLMADFDAAYQTVLTSVSQEATEWLPRQFVNLKVPTLLIAGEKDQIIPAKMGHQAATLNEQIEFKVIQNTAHFPMLEDAATYLQQVRQFLSVSEPL